MRKWSFRFVAVAGLLVLGAGIGLWFQGPEWTQEEIENVVVTTLQRETPASFLITGTLELTATVSSRSSKVFMPNLFNLDLGTTESRIRAPGRVAYGFDIRNLATEHITVMEDGLIEIEIPALEVFSVEPDLMAMEIETEVGWARRQNSSGRDQEGRALAHVQEAMREQAREHLETAEQPRINTAYALRDMLTPTLSAAGLQNPRFRFAFGQGFTLEPS